MNGTVVFVSITGNTEYFVSRTNLKTVSLNKYDQMVVDEPFVLVVPSYEEHVLPDVIDMVRYFLDDKENQKNCIGVFASGNVNFGDALFGVTGKIIAREYDLPLLHTFELMGSEEDVRKLEGVFSEH